MNTIAKLIEALDPKYVESLPSLIKQSTLADNIAEIQRADIREKDKIMAEIVERSHQAIGVKEKQSEPRSTGGRRPRKYSRRQERTSKSAPQKMQTKYKSKTRSNKH